MSKFAELPTKKARVEFIREKVRTDERWMIKGVLTIFEYQTEDEKSSEDAKIHNGVGFSRFDAQIMSDFAKKLIRKGALDAINSNEPVNCAMYLSPGEENVLKHRIGKYAGQLARIADMKCPLIKKRKAA